MDYEREGQKMSSQWKVRRDKDMVMQEEKEKRDHEKVMIELELLSAKNRAAGIAAG